ncbi:hypothetical protein SO694_00088149 [Aureococcus anophagefferens]|uniref:Band 7 domain-containing protein n=1 Tax=Aureococcus anophagefferens TaxID=44056 RepID=A0ABR1G3P2_AURAN
MSRDAPDQEDHSFYEDTPAYKALKDANVLETKYRRSSVEDIFTGTDVVARANKASNLAARCAHGYFCLPGLGCCLYHATHMELFVPAGHVGLLMDGENRYLFAQPGMHNIQSIFIRSVGTKPLRGLIQHGNRTIVVVEQGYLGYARDNGQPVLLPPGIHVWTSESLEFVESKPLDDHLCHFGPYTLVTVDEGYAAVTQNNGRQHILDGGFTHFLSHKNWRFEKFMTLKIQTDELERIEATSADNINMTVTSTVNWRIKEVRVAATMAAETMNSSGTGTVSADISKLRRDVLKQAIASLAGFIGSVNYSNSFHVAAAAQASREAPPLAEAVPVADEETPPAFNDNPLYDEEKMSSAVEHANKVTRTYGVEIMSINIISATPCDQALTRALASGAVASAEALQAETAARGQARAISIAAEAEASRCKIAAEGEANAKLVHARADAEAERTRAEGAKQAADLIASSEVAVDLAKMDRSAKMLSGGEKYFFGQEPSMLSNIVLREGDAQGRGLASAGVV